MGNCDDDLVKRGEYVPLIFRVPSWFVLGMMISRLFLIPLLSLVGANGMLETWLQSKGLGDANKVIAYFAVSKLGEPPTDGKTGTNPDGLTTAYGKWASTVAGKLLAEGLSCKEKLGPSRRVIVKYGYPFPHPCWG